MQRLKVGLFILLLVFGFILRLYRFDNPIADWHSWRQSDTSSVSREFVKNGFDLLHPTYHDLSNLSGPHLPNPKGYRFVEFPIYNFLQAGLYVAFGNLTIEEWGRILSILSSEIAAVFIFLLIKKYVNIKTAFLGLGFYLFLPFNIYYGRVILPDPMMVASLLAGIYFFDKWLEGKNFSRSMRDPASAGQFSIAVLFTATAILLKPYALFFVLPFIVLAFNQFGIGFIKKRQLWLFALVSILPFILWRIWMSQYPEGIPDSKWLFNGGNIRFTGAFFYWLFADRVSRLILGYFGVALVILGFLRKFDKSMLFFLSFIVSSLLYMVVIAKGNVNHDYYQILIVPSLVIFMALGVDFLLKHGGALFPKPLGYGLILICSVFSFMFGWYFIRDFFNINNPSIVEAGRAADKILPKDARIIAPYGGDTAFLYQTNRSGWPDWTLTVSEMINLGATHLVVANPTEGDQKLKNDFKILKETPRYIIFDIRKGP